MAIESPASLRSRDVVGNPIADEANVAERAPLSIHRCQHIRCKGMVVHGENYLAPTNELLRTNDFWCQHTQNCLGPDGGLVLMSRCADGRSCYESL